MFQELAPEQFARFRPLFEGFDYSLSLQAAIEGLSPRRMFAERTENPDYYDHLAALAWGHLGNAEKALHYLPPAVDLGWRYVEWTRQQPGLSLLHGLPEWARILTRMAGWES
jgi:hypothetical protein